MGVTISGRTPDRKRRTSPLRVGHAILSINWSLDFDTVLRDVVDSAQALMGSRYGGMVVFDAAGELQSFVTSGFDAEGHQRLIVLPEKFELFRHFSRLSKPVRVREFNGLARSLGFTGLRLPMRVDEEFVFLVGARHALS